MDEPLTTYAAPLRYPICPECLGNLFLPAEHAAGFTCPDCGLELRLLQPGVEETPTSYYVSTLVLQKRQKPPPRVDGPTDVRRLLRPLLRDADREMFYSILLSTKNHVHEINLVSVGSLSASIVHPREVLKPAIRRSAAAIIVAHNHPSGVPTPSPEDIELTRRLARAGELVGIRLLDHVILAGDRYESLKEGGFF